MKVHFIIFFLLTIVQVNQSTLSKSDAPRQKKSKAKQVSEKVKGPISKDVNQRNLIKREAFKSPAEIIENHSGFFEEVSKRNVDFEVLGYITPWNSKGYDIAKTFGNKFTSISPVWLQVVPTSDPKKPYITMGTHDIDKGWMAEVNRKGPNVKVIPRVLFDKWSGQDYGDLFSNPSRSDTLANVIMNTISEYNFDGIVLEVWSQLGGQAKPQLTQVINKIGKAVRRKGHTFVLVIPPPVYSGDAPGMFNAKDLKNLADNVDYFSLMTYDYSNPTRPGPNSPTPWVNKCIDLLDPEQLNRDKILMGINFYGYDYTAAGGGPIVGHEYINLLKSAVNTLKDSPNFKWDSKSYEHFIEFKLENNKKGHTIFFPTLASIESKISLVKENKLAGIAIWELGQGLDYFYDLL